MAVRKRVPALIFSGFPDTVVVHLWCAKLMTLERVRLRDVYGDFCDTRIRAGDAKLTRIIMQCPQPHILDEVQALLNKYNGRITRIDMNFEARPSIHKTAQQQMALIRQMLVMKRRRSGPIKEYRNSHDRHDDGFTFIPNAHKRRVACDIGGYPDLEPKLHNAEVVAKFEPRLRGQRGFGRPRNGNLPRDHWIASLTDLKTCNIGALVTRHLSFKEYDEREFRKRLFAGQSPEWIEHIRANWHSPEFQFHFGQRIHDYDPRFPMSDASQLVPLPSAITWGARRRTNPRFIKSDDDD